jgi:hypothetical protein
VLVARDDGDAMVHALFRERKDDLGDVDSGNDRRARSQQAASVRRGEVRTRTDRDA